jgi:esterase/lipase superfamily enzyme
MIFPGRARLTVVTVVFTCFFLVSCQHSVYLMPTPAAFKTGAVDPFANTPESQRNSSILIGYATNRLPIGAKESRFYSRDFDETIRMGVAEVQIGAGDKSWDEIQAISFDNSRQKIDSLLTLQNATEMGKIEKDQSFEKLSPQLQKMIDRFNKAIEASPFKEITVYVHGANNNFYRTAAQAAQYRHYTGRQAIVVLFSWPSAESILRYGTDVRHIVKTVPTFVRYLKLLAEHTNARRINILAYSAGATLTTRSLAALGNDKSNEDRDAYRKSLRLGSIYFAAPDTDFDSFIDEYRSYQDLVDSVTITVNRHDTVLGIAREEHKSRNQSDLIASSPPASGKSRLGKPDLADITAEDREWLARQTTEANFYVINIDPGTVPDMTKGSHDYWYQNTWASTDALIALNLHVPPGERGLVLMETPGSAQIWNFPADYDDHIGDILKSVIMGLKAAPRLEQ